MYAEKKIHSHENNRTYRCENLSALNLMGNNSFRIKCKKITKQTESKTEATRII